MVRNPGKDALGVFFLVETVELETHHDKVDDGRDSQELYQRVDKITDGVRNDWCAVSSPLSDKVEALEAALPDQK